MSASDERRRFERRHAAESVRITVLTGEHAGGAGRVDGDELWTASADVLAYVDERGEVVEERGRVSWLVADDERGTELGGTWIHDLQPLTQYVLRVRRAAPDPAEYAAYGFEVPDLPHHFALDEVLERHVHVSALDERLARRVESADVTTDLGEFELDRPLDAFVGSFDWCGRTVRVTLGVDDDAVEGSETCVATLERLRELVAHATTVDATWRSFAASTLEPAGEWLRDSARAAGLEESTIESIAHGLRLSELSVDPDGSANAYYGDDGLFRDVAVVVEIDPDGTPTDASVSG
ncbi:DUF2262 domain-containing protein [Pseudoclavibacter chungangensis]|uniref:DUF2262 domain-containing protein n=1 Tax=Pseudoclavibacter chungangensis TaxID=587635 RepID=A0A7J5BQN9_9MICO|nr:DUF2262 domain-containing protein [Pseudoclavibacter chungangensis]KAB1656286.1 DUF2262 domain-containing protein [Pseudoclavibacter chungangensis]NYJ67046.1 hypothetical protein [Pseudoclavibacter chungangensis]